MKKIKTINLPIYPGELKIVYTDEVKKVNTFMEKDIDEETFSYYSALTINGGSDVTLVFNAAEKGINISDIAHEGLHAVNRIMNYISHTPDRINDEPDAYLLTWINSKVVKFARDNNIELK